MTDRRKQGACRNVEAHLAQSHEKAAPDKNGQATAENPAAHPCVKDREKNI